MTAAKPQQQRKTPTRASSASSFKKTNLPLIELPSGNWVRVRRPGMETFITAGFLPDSLAKEISSMVNKRSGKAQDIAVLQNPTPEALAEYLRSLDKIAAYCIAEPPVVWHERQKKIDSVPAVDANGEPELEVIPDGDRSSDVVYTDELEMEDKSFVFQYAVGGTADLSQFRKKSDALMAALQSSGDVGEAP
jgi:hypothetical protein